MPRRRDEYEEYDAVDQGVDDGGNARRKRGRSDIFGDYPAEEHEDHGGRGGGRGKRNRQAASEFFYTEAAVDSDEEEEEEGEGDEGDDEFIDVGADIPNEAGTRIHQQFAQTRTIPRDPLSPMRRPPRGGYSGLGNFGGEEGGGRGDDDALIGVAAKICRGAYKGFWGRVKGVIGSRVRIKLESQLKVVEVLRSNVNVSRLRETWRYGMESRIPMHPYRIPMRDSGGVIPSPPHQGTKELPTEDIIMRGSEPIFGPNGDSCRICLGEYKAQERLRLIRKCNHCFHVDCLHQWLIRKSSCPVCRTNVN